MPHYLFGPVDLHFAAQKLRTYREKGDCLFFDTSGLCDVAMEPWDSWKKIAGHFPQGWDPDFVVLCLPHKPIPDGLWQAPVPLVAIAPDWQLHWHFYRKVLQRFDLVLTDAPGVAALQRQGITSCRSCCLTGGETSWLTPSKPAAERDLDVLFVGDVQAATHAERLPWLDRIAALGERWNVLVTSGVSESEYRHLMSRARIVFNYSVSGKCNKRVFETLASGALLFQEATNREVATLLHDRQECVFYNSDNLEELLQHYLESESERRVIADRGHQRSSEFTWERLWEETVRSILHELPTLQSRCPQRPKVGPTDRLSYRVLQCNSVPIHDPELIDDLSAVLSSTPKSASLLNSLGLAVARSADRDTKSASLEYAAKCFQSAWQCDPACLMAGLNAVEILALLGHKEQAIQHGQALLELMGDENVSFVNTLEDGHCPAGLDEFRVGWEKASWQNAGCLDAEIAAKRVLLRWRVHTLLGSVTEDIGHFYEAYAAQAHLTVTRVELGRALLRMEKRHLAIHHLRAALEQTPFDGEISQVCINLLGQLGLVAEQGKLIHHQRLLARVAPKLSDKELRVQPDSCPSMIAAEAMSPLSILWQGELEGDAALGSMSRSLCNRLLQRGHDVQTNSRLEMLSSVDVAISYGDRASLLRPNCKYWIVWLGWPLTGFPMRWLKALQQADDIWVPSDSLREHWIEHGLPPERTSVLPWCAPAIENAAPYTLKTTKTCKFLFVGTASFLEGLDVLLSAYSQVFSAQDNVCLVIHLRRAAQHSSDQEAAQRVQALLEALGLDAQGAEVELIAADLTSQQIDGLYTACDCVISPHRGLLMQEPVLQGMAKGLPVVISASGSALEVCTDDCAYFLPIASVRANAKNVLGEETATLPVWAEPDADMLRCFLRHITQHPEEGKIKGMLGRALIQRHFSPEVTVNRIEQRLRLLLGRPSRRNALPAKAASTTWSNQQWDNSPTYSANSPSVSLTMIVKNEESNLAPCLASVRDLVDEIIVVDTGSTDATIAIARSMGAKVHSFPWIDDFSAARNEALRHARGRWIFWMDADDRLDEANRHKLGALLRQLPDETAGYVMKCACLPDPKTQTTTVVDHIRLFRNHPELRWKYRVHEQILGALRGLQANIHWSDVVIQHVGYQDSALRQRKLQRDLRLLTLEQREHPNDPFVLFNLGSVYQEQGRFAEALTALRASLKLSHPSDSITRKLYALIAQCHRQKRETSQAIEVCQQGQRIYPQDAELLYIEGMIHREQGERAAAIITLEKILAAKDSQQFASVDEGLRSYKTHYHLATLHQELGDFEKATWHWNEALKAKSDFLPAWQGLAEHFLAKRQWKELQALLTRMHGQPVAQLEAQVLEARLCQQQGKLTEAKRLLEHIVTKYPNALYPRVMLSHVLLQEGIDWDHAERALRDVLALEPHHEEARKNLATLIAQRKRPGPAVANSEPTNQP